MRWRPLIVLNSVVYQIRHVANVARAPLRMREASFTVPYVLRPIRKPLSIPRRLA